jgi:6-pyruvoyltetrahydropterin/6-carboxytetrahydropterin synthase
MDKQRVAVYRKEHFNAAHRLHNPAWDDQTNERVFGKCNLPHYHGHNYELIIKLIGVPDPDTGYVMDLKRLSDLVREVVIERFDHKNLNLDTVEFKDLNPTAEHIVQVIFRLLRPEIPGDLDLEVTLFETERNFVSFPA